MLESFRSTSDWKNSCSSCLFINERSNVPWSSIFGDIPWAADVAVCNMQDFMVQKYFRFDDIRFGQFTTAQYDNVVCTAEFKTSNPVTVFFLQLMSFRRTWLNLSLHWFTSEMQPTI